MDMENVEGRGKGRNCRNGIEKGEQGRGINTEKRGATHDWSTVEIRYEGGETSTREADRVQREIKGVRETGFIQPPFKNSGTAAL